MTFYQEHPDPDYLLQFVADELGEQEACEVSAHIDSCKDCQKSLETLVECDSYIAKTLRVSDPNSLSFKNEDHLLIIEKIASGGMGVVYRGYDRELKREVAIKIARDGERKSREIRFYREAQIASQLQHPGIVPVYRIGKLKDGRQFIAMKVVEGQTFKRKIVDHHSNDADSVSRLLDVFQQICQTIAYAHSRGVIHRDLKPENVMVGDYGEVQVMDWGLAKRIGFENDRIGFGNEQTKNDLPIEMKQRKTNQRDTKLEDAGTANAYETVLGSVVGTPAYMPPEQASGRNVDFRADVFALGAILCEILTGAPPYGDSSKTLTTEKAIECDLEDTSSRLAHCDFDADIVALTKVCLSPQPDDRPANAGAVSSRLHEIVARNEDRRREAELNQARSAERLVAEKKRRNQLLWSAAMIGGVLLLASAATIMFLYERNVRQAEQHERSLEAGRQRLTDERELGKIIGRATERTTTALLAGDSQKLEKWEIAKTEIAHAENLVAKTESEELRAEYNSLKEEIESGIAEANSRIEQFELADQLQQAVDFVSEVSKYPVALTESVWSGKRPEALKHLNTTFDTTFEKLGVEKFGKLEQAVEALEVFEDRDLVVKSVLLWQIQTLNKIEELNPGSAEYLRKRDWFFELSNAIDGDPIRCELRKAYGDAQSILSLAENPEATSSPLTCYWLAQMIQGTDDDTRLKKLEFLKQAHARHPDDVEINWQLGIFFEPGGWPAGCRTSLRHVLFCHAAQPDNIGVVERLARMYNYLNERELAIEFGQRLVGLCPDSDYANSLMADIYVKQKKNGEAIEYARKAIEINTKLIDPYVCISRAHSHRRDYEKALEIVRELEDLYPDEGLVHRCRADIYLQSKRYEEALESILEAKKQYPNEFWTLRLLAVIYQRNSKWHESIEVYQYMIKHFDQNPIYQIRLATAYLETGKPVLAENVLRQVWRKRKYLPKIWTLMNRALVEQGKPEEVDDSSEVDLTTGPSD